ncbi:glucosaminidase domain-containing protein [Streptococcus merionis]|uniref:glucosaminidase domain-containing protein n=1 Tax=Streptococcus merionis TaxID=400065 RepID=UPI0026F1C159|nr:glucosaminidase domain-containing protein [Streptococcus merionis]
MLAVLVALLFLGLWIRRDLMMQAEQKAFAQANRSAFVEIVGKTAEDLAHQHDLYASVMVAQAILESDWGQSQLTKEANNLFGIKGDYWGQFYEIETAEDDGTGNLYTVVARFRKYPTYHASLKDNAKLLSKGLAGAPDFYAGAWKSQTSSYQEATAYLQGRYATDTSYASKLNALIEQYDLTRFDR